MRRARGFGWVAGAGLLLCLLFIASLALGSVTIPLFDVVRVLSGREAETAAFAKIILLFRLPKAITAILAGASLALAGLLMQTLFSNPLAGPSVLGINSGAGLGVAVAVLAGEAFRGAAARSAAGASGAAAAAMGTETAGTVIGAGAPGASATTGGTGAAAALLEEASLAGNISIALAAAAGAAVVLLLVLFTSRKVGNVMTLLLLGILFGFAADAAVSVLMHLSAADRIQAYVFWSFGSFQGVPLDGLWLFAACAVPGIALGIAAAKGLNALLLGEGYARTMGVPVGALRVLVVIATALLAGSTTAFCGPITFIGIAVPHLTRSLFATSDHRRLIPGVLLIGASAAIFSDIVAQLPGTDMVLPLNAVTSLLGAPVIIWVILRKRNIQEGFSA